MMKDLTRGCFNKESLSFEVVSDDYFYNEKDDIDYLLALCDEEFIYTDEQKETLLNNLNDWKG